MAACCRWPPSARGDAAVRALATPRVDWGGVLRASSRQRVEGLVNEALRRTAVRPPDPVAEALAQAAARTARQGLVLAAETCRLQALLDAAGLANLALKGASLERIAYGRLGLKSAWDIDLLVEPRSIGPARACLERAGYRLASPAGLEPAAFATWATFSKECVFVHRTSGVVVELHWRVTDSPRLLASLCATSPSQSVPLAADLVVRTLAREELFAYLCVHGASHGWSRLKWLADLAAMVSADKGSDLAALHGSSQRLGAGACAAQALLLAHRLLGLALAPDLEAQLRSDPKARWLEAIALGAMTGGAGRETVERPLGAERIQLSHLLFGHGWGYRWAELRRQGVSLDDRLNIPLPRGLTWLYPLIRGPSLVARRLARSLRRP